MNYLENKVKELFEQVLRGEKKAPKFSIGNLTNAHYLEFNKDLIVVKRNKWLEVVLEGKVNPLFEDDRDKYKCFVNMIYLGLFDENADEPTPSNEMLLVSRLFDEVVEYTNKPQRDKYLIDKIFGELE